jgi:hypothetical protein
VAHLGQVWGLGDRDIDRVTHLNAMRQFQCDHFSVHGGRAAGQGRRARRVGAVQPPGRSQRRGQHPLQPARDVAVRLISPRPIVGFAPGTQGLGDNCAPSKSMANSLFYEGGHVQSLPNAPVGIWGSSQGGQAAAVAEQESTYPRAQHRRLRSGRTATDAGHARPSY